MADYFDTVDCVYNKVVLSGFPTYKDKALEKTVTEGILEFVVINISSGQYGQVSNQMMVNVNLFVPKTTSGMIDRSRIIAMKNIIDPLVQSAVLTNGYLSAKPLFDHLITDESGKYDYLNLRYDIIITA